MEFTLPMKIHFRYCWLFSGLPMCNTSDLVNRPRSLTDRESIGFNRTMMTSEQPELYRHDKTAYNQDVKAFWLTTTGRLVHVDRLSEDVKFRHLRQQNLRVALSLWTTNPDLCEQTMRLSNCAHTNLITICGEAASLSKGRFYNLYANYPLPINAEGDEKVLSLDSIWVNENDINSSEIRNGRELLIQLQPLYAAYFRFITDNSTSNDLRERVLLLGAQWLVEADCSELEFSLNLRSNWFTRMCIILSLFMDMS